MQLPNPRYFLPAVILMTLIIASLAASLARGEDPVDLAIIAWIESSNNPLAYNAKSGACGMYQITAICLTEYNRLNPGRKMTRKALFDPKKAILVSDWYVNRRIPQMLQAFRLPDTLDNRLWCYNAGIGLCRKGIMPKETKNYIKKYKALNGRKG